MFTFLMENGWNGDTPHSLSRNTPFYNVVTHSKVISIMSQKKQYYLILLAVLKVRFLNLKFDFQKGISIILI